MLNPYYEIQELFQGSAPLPSAFCSNELLLADFPLRLPNRASWRVIATALLPFHHTYHPFPRTRPVPRKKRQLTICPAKSVILPQTDDLCGFDTHGREVCKDKEESEQDLPINHSGHTAGALCTSYLGPQLDHRQPKALREGARPAVLNLALIARLGYNKMTDRRALPQD